MKLGDFIPLLLSRAFEPTFVNICFDRPPACSSQLHNEGVGTKLSSFQQNLRRSTDHKVESMKLGQQLKILFFSNLDDMMGVALGCNTYIHTKLENIQVRI